MLPAPARHAVRLAALLAVLASLPACMSTEPAAVAVAPAAAGQPARLLPPPPAGRPSLRLAFVIAAGSGWTIDDLQHQAGGLADRLAICGIALEPIPVAVGVGQGPDWNDSRAERDRLAARAGERRWPVLFAGRIRAGGEPAIEGRSFALADPPMAVIARQGGKTPDGAGKQTLAHEVGHLLGLAHGRPGRLDLMAPHGCRTCEFAPAQCLKMRESLRERPA